MRNLYGHPLSVGQNGRIKRIEPLLGGRMHVLGPSELGHAAHGVQHPCRGGGRAGGAQGTTAALARGTHAHMRREMQRKTLRKHFCKFNELQRLHYSEKKVNAR